MKQHLLRPVGAFEVEKFAKGTRSVLQDIITATQNGAVTLLGGTTTSACVTRLGAPTRSLTVAPAFNEGVYP